MRNVIRYDTDGAPGVGAGPRRGALRARCRSSPPTSPPTALASTACCCRRWPARAARTRRPGCARAQCGHDLLRPAGGLPRGQRGELLEAVRACDVFLPSEVEAVRLAGTADPAGGHRGLPGARPADRRRQAAPRRAAWWRRAKHRADAGPHRRHRRRSTAPAPATPSAGRFAAEHLRSGDAVARPRTPGLRAARIAVSGARRRPPCSPPRRRADPMSRRITMRQPQHVGE